jgi:hypothetical protein
VVALGVWLRGRWFLVAFCGACGWNITIDSSRTKKEPLRSSFLFFFFFYSLYSWTAAFLALLVFSFNVFLVLFYSSS